MTEVLLTGGAGHLGRALLPALLAHPSQPRVVVVDRQPAILVHPRLTWRQVDLRLAPWEEWLPGVQSIIHLAFVVLSPHYGPQWSWRRAMAGVNRSATWRLVQAAARSGVAHILVSSSVSVYGAWPDNPIPITEEQALRPPPGFAYAEDKAAVENLLEIASKLYPHLGIARLRLHAIVGPRAQALVNGIACSPLGLRLPNPDLPVQCLHEEDAVAALLVAWEKQSRGIFHVAAPDPIPWSAIPRQRQLPITPRQLHAMHQLLRPVTRLLGDPGWLLGLEYPLIVDIGKGQREWDWRPRYSVATALAAVREECCAKVRRAN
ncbi:MAG: NAD-dependent epimerase/dehydratase family protein [Acidithiobacillus sp.]|nr:NAD-dependent epimerase/dehydratase family protein [Acidithiobacillus sp.]